MGLVNKSDYIYAKLLDKASEISEQLIEVDDKEIIRLGLESQDILTVSIDHIEWANTESLETYQGTKATLPKINIYWDDETVTETSINYTMVNNVSYYLEAGNYEIHAVYRNFTSTNTLPITVIEKVLVSIEWENTNPITTQQNHKAYLPYIKLNYNDGKYKRLSSNSPGVTLNENEYWLELGEKTLTATYKGFTTNELIINVIEENNSIIDDPNTEEDEEYEYWKTQYLTLEALEDGLLINGPSGLYYSLDNGITWYSYSSSINSEIIYKGTNVLLKGTFRETNTPIVFSGHFNIKGNIMSLMYGDDFKDQFNFYSSNTYWYNGFHELFKNTKIINAKNLILPATSLILNCYASMFEGCLELISAPKLPALNLSQGCYCKMFKGCILLTKAPELPALQMKTECYAYMFEDCISLLKAPELPATSLWYQCYEGMFKNCKSITSTPEFKKSTINNCYASMFEGCSSLKNISELPATSLGHHCYYKMFKDCTSLIDISYLTIGNENSTFERGGGNDGTYTCGFMFEGCTSLIYGPQLPALSLVSEIYYGMFKGCTSLTTAPELPAITLASNCYDSMFEGCTQLTTAPELYSKALAQDSYNYMFKNCTSLNYIKCLCSIFIYSGTFNWLYNVALSGTFIKAKEVEWSIGNSGIPHGWAVQEIDPETGEIVNEYINE